jgi:hypothetical protein
MENIVVYLLLGVGCGMVVKPDLTKGLLQHVMRVFGLLIILAIFLNAITGR